MRGSIKCDFKNTAVLSVNYEEILKKKIDRVCSRIGFDDSKITWFIFDPAERKSKATMWPIRIGLNGKDYGYCIPSQNEVRISVLSIMKDSEASRMEQLYSRIKMPKIKEDDFLADVILDEITHIQTGCDHGNAKYDKRLWENAEKYYLPAADGLL